MKKILLISHCIFFCISTSLFAFEDPEKLTYLTENFFPYNYVENGKIEGYSIDLLKMIWQEIGTEPQEIHVYPWARAYKLLQNENNIVLFTTAKTKKRAEKFKWVGPISQNTRTVLLSLKKNNFGIKSLEDAKKFKIGTIRNDAAEQILLSKGFSKNQIEPASKFDHNLKKINVGRIDLIAFDEHSFYNALKKGGILGDKYKTVLVVNETEPCFAFSKNVSDELILKFQNAFNVIKQTKEYQILLDKYFKVE